LVKQAPWLNHPDICHRADSRRQRQVTTRRSL
jgi:hypothetical protein